MTCLNPLFEREWRARFRRHSSHLQLALPVVAMTALVCFGVWRDSFAPGLTVMQWRAHGLALLDSYRWMAALVIWSTALLIGATSVSDEKASATWEELLLCPMGGRGISLGKIASSAVWLLLLQLVLLPPLIVAGLCFGAKPLEIGSVMFSHLLFTIQGATLGFCGALRGRSLAEGVVLSLTDLGRLLLHCVLLLVFVLLGMALWGLLSSTIAFLRFPTPITFLRTAFFFAVTNIIPVIKTLSTVMLGVTGIGIPLRHATFYGNQLSLSPPLLLAGQLLGIALILKWSVWQVDNPRHDFGAKNPALGEGQKPFIHLFVLYAAWNWTLTPEQLNTFSLYDIDNEHQSADEPEFHPLASLLLARRNGKELGRKPAPPGDAVMRFRIPIQRRLIELNPVLWLDLTRVLSLRAPESVLLPVAVFVTALGGWVLWESLSILHGWISNAQFGSAGDKATLREGWEKVRWLLLFAALAGGPLWGASGYVVERRSELLLELHLTLLSAFTMCWGKFLARFIAFGLFSLPLLALVAFFARNWPYKNGVGETMTAVFSMWLLAAWSLMICLCISDACRKGLTATLCCVAFAVIWGVLIWQFPDALWNLSHLIGTAIASFYLCWRLKRLGFG
ncbi:hypothetical protein IAD21_00966 [Abditibacteriota bacterium]|nr:hypothetical protein IAD21_00966 [Abditibacteriota bacterium]